MSSAKKPAQQTATMILIVKGHGYPQQFFGDPVEFQSSPVAVGADDFIRDVAERAYAKLKERFPK